MSRSKSVPSARPAGKGRHFEPPPRQRAPQDTSKPISKVPLESPQKQAQQNHPGSPASEAGADFTGAAGLGCQSKDRDRCRKTGYAWGKVQEAESAVRRAYSGAAGTVSGINEDQVQRKRVVFHHAAASKNFHRGLHSGDVQDGVYDFHPSSQGRRARSAPRRKSVAGGIIRGEFAPEAERSDNFQGTYEAWSACARRRGARVDQGA